MIGYLAETGQTMRRSGYPTPSGRRNRNTPSVARSPATHAMKPFAARAHIPRALLRDDPRRRLQPSPKRRADDAGVVAERGRAEADAVDFRYAAVRTGRGFRHAVVAAARRRRHLRRSPQPQAQSARWLPARAMPNQCPAVSITSAATGSPSSATSATITGVIARRSPRQASIRAVLNPWTMHGVPPRPRYEPLAPPWRARARAPAPCLLPLPLARTRAPPRAAHPAAVLSTAPLATCAARGPSLATMRCPISPRRAPTPNTHLVVRDDRAWQSRSQPPPAERFRAGPLRRAGARLTSEGLCHHSGALPADLAGFRHQ